INVGGKNIRAAEQTLEAAYRDRQFLKDPMVSVAVVSYKSREVSVLGSVRSPGTVAFPRDTTSLDIVEIITRVGGFLPIAKSDAVTVTHRQADGTDKVTTVDLEDAITGRPQRGKDRTTIMVYPGDRIWVPERLF
ncbi:MAG: sugar transporter, partial [Opitutaceae bacterium]